MEGFEPRRWSARWTPLRGLASCLAHGVLGLLVLHLAADAPVSSRRSGDLKVRALDLMLRAPEGRVVVAGAGVYLILTGVWYLCAGVRRQVVISLDESGIDVWQWGRIHHTRWDDLVGLRVRRRLGVDVLELTRFERRTLRITVRHVPDGLDALRFELKFWLMRTRPYVWREVLVGLT